MALSIKVVGVGPGSQGYLTSVARETIREAQVLVGGRRLLQEFAFPGQQKYFLQGKMEEALTFIRQESACQQVVVLVSGDTGIFSFAAYLQKYLEPDEMEFIPGVSSFQLLFARIKRSWEGASFFSVHGRPPGYLSQLVRERPITVLFTGSKWAPPDVAHHLLQEGLPDLPVVLGKDLSLPSEEVRWASLTEVADFKLRWENSLMVIFNE